MKKILLTGCSGYIGFFLVNRFIASRKYRLFVLPDDLTTDDFSIPDVDVVLHLAGKQNYSYNGSPEELITANFQGTVNLAKKCRQDTHFIFMSSDYVFESNPTKNYNEQDEVNPETTYGKAKVMAERYLLENIPNISILRTSLIYGYDHPRRKNFFWFVKSKLEKGEQVELFTDVSSRPTYISDLCKVISEVVDRELYGLYHFSGRELINRFDLGALICRLGGFDSKLLIPVKKPENVGIPKCLSMETSATFENERVTSLDKGINDWFTNAILQSVMLR